MVNPVLSYGNGILSSKEVIKLIGSWLNASKNERVNFWKRRARDGFLISE